ncbi:ABC transporter substrate-binding protein [Haladaptatus sp. CMSO5]|uniref:ABC transporter substrate-binding protein n=1 Tax=Haladaptatus sp. CMSO5 TaxID=3120514 RepID=UPI002FCE502F
MSENSDLSRRTVLKGVGSLAGVSALAGCSSVLGTDANASIRYAQALAPKSLDPVRIADPWSASVATNVFEGLYRYDHDMNLVPELAAGTPTVENDGKTHIVKLTDGATFQDGTAVTAEDVAYSYRAVREEERPDMWQVRPIDHIEVRDEQTVAFHLKNPYPAMDHALTRGIVPKAVRESNPEMFAHEKPVGSGPYEVETAKPGEHVSLTHWTEYWGETNPSLEHARFVQNHSDLARTTSLKTGQNDIVERVNPGLWSVTQDLSNADTALQEGYLAHYIGFNCNEGPTADPKVRKAIDSLVDLDTVTETFVGPIGRRQYGLLPPQLAAEWDLPVEEWQSIPRAKNKEKAKQLLKEADVGNWAPTIAVPKHDLLREKIAEELAHGLAEIGFYRARTEKYPWKEFREKIVSGSPSEYNIFVDAWAGGPDPDTYLYPLFHENAEGRTNGAFYQNEDVMNALRDARRTTDDATRRDLYESATRTLLTERVALPAFTLDNSFGVASGIEGFGPHPLPGENPRLETIESTE